MARESTYPILAELKAGRWHSAVLMHRQTCPWIDECLITEFDFEHEAECLIAQLNLAAELSGKESLGKLAVELKEWCKEKHYRV